MSSEADTDELSAFGDIWLGEKAKEPGFVLDEDALDVFDKDYAKRLPGSAVITDTDAWRPVQRNFLPLQPSKADDNEKAH